MSDDASIQPVVRSAGNGRAIFTPVTAVILATVIIIASTAAALAFRGTDPDGGSVEAGFLRDMVTHHSQAVEMSLIDYRRTADPEMVVLSYDIATAQQAQIGMMMATLDLWGLSQTGSDRPMTWMGAPSTGLLPGMATPEQVALLQSLPADQADILLLQLMIVHHRAGIDMANAVLGRSDNQEVRRLAGTFSRTQGVEIDNMNAMLIARGQPPIDGMTIPGSENMNGITTTTNDATPMDMGHGG